MRICLVLEGCYPYVHGGVSTWMHGYITAMPEHEFVLWVIGAHAEDRGKFVYELPGNVVEVHEVFLDDALRLSGEQEEVDFDDREREEEIIRADWVVPSFKDRWIRFFYLLSEEIYRRAFRVTSLFHNARKTQIDMGCDADKCLVIPNGIQFDRFKDIPLKPDDGWVDIGAVVRLAPIKDVKTMIYAFFELHERMPHVRLHIMGGVDDEEYGAECHALVETLGVRDLIFTGRVNVVEYMEKLDFTILTSISEGQPLSVLESLGARRPCVTTEVGCCRELLEGAPGDDFGVAGFVSPPMYRKGLADAMERMCASRARRLEMGERGQRRVATYYLHEQMLANYRALYDETARAFNLPKKEV